jgi:hypothetical protein
MTPLRNSRISHAPLFEKINLAKILNRYDLKHSPTSYGIRGRPLPTILVTQTFRKITRDVDNNGGTSIIPGGSCGRWGARHTGGGMVAQVEGYVWMRRRRLAAAGEGGGGGVIISR